MGKYVYFHIFTVESVVDQVRSMILIRYHPNIFKILNQLLLRIATGIVCRFSFHISKRLN